MMGRKPPCYGPFGGVGDLNGNGEVDIGDLVIINNASVGDVILSPDAAKRADLNGNGTPADIGDIILMNNYLVGDIDTFPACSLPGYTPDPQNMETRTVSLSEGQHNIQLSLAGYDTLNATINVTASGVTCISVVGGACGGSGLPRVSTSGFTASAYLKAGTAVSDVCSWITSVGGIGNLQWAAHVLEAYYVYIGASGHNVGFSPVTWDDVLGLYYYYINDNAAGNGKIGCGT